MKNKFSLEIKAEIDEIKHKIQIWKNLFDIEIELYIDGWAIFLREKNLYPRIIIIFKSYASGTYSIKSFEVHFNNFKNEEFKELYTQDNIKDQKNLLDELKKVIYGKDLISEASKIYKSAFLK